MEDLDTSLDEIACRFGTDKSSLTVLTRSDGEYPLARPEVGHGYTFFYEHYFKRLRTASLRLLEIGVLDGRSLATWREYFPNASLYGLDLNPNCSRFQGERVKIFIGSQSDPKVLADVCQQVPEGFDIIIDDGSHYVKHIIASFHGLFEHLNAGGLYVIEDLNLAASRQWGSTAWNRGMAMEAGPPGNDPDEMVQFLKAVRARHDVIDMAVHLKRIAFIRKRTDEAEPRPLYDRGDKLDDLFPPPPRKRTVLERVARRLLRIP